MIKTPTEPLGDGTVWDALDQEQTTILKKEYLPEGYFGEVETLLLTQTPLIGRLLPFADQQYDAIQFLFCALFNQSLEHVRNRLNVSECIYGVVLDCAAENAVAIALDDGSYCVLMTIGFIANLNAYAGAWCRTAPIASMLPSGNATITRDNYLDVERDDYLPRPIEEYLDVFNPIANRAALCVILHELGHIVNGHLRRAANSRQGMLLEIDGSPSENDLRRLVREFDADAFAIQHVIQILHPPGVSLSEGQLALNLTACSALYSFMARRDTYQADWLERPRGHPPAIHRLFCALMTADKLLRQSHPHLPDSAFESLFALVVSPSLDAAELVRGKGAFTDVNELDQFVKVNDAFVDLMTKTWATHREDFAKAKLGTHNLAPASELGAQ